MSNRSNFSSLCDSLGNVSKQACSRISPSGRSQCPRVVVSTDQLQISKVCLVVIAWDRIPFQPNPWLLFVLQYHQMARMFLPSWPKGFANTAPWLSHYLSRPRSVLGKVEAQSCRYFLWHQRLLMKGPLRAFHLCQKIFWSYRSKYAVSIEDHAVWGR